MWQQCFYLAVKPKDKQQFYALKFDWHFTYMMFWEFSNDFAVLKIPSAKQAFSNIENSPMILLYYKYHLRANILYYWEFSFFYKRLIFLNQTTLL